VVDSEKVRVAGRPIEAVQLRSSIALKGRTPPTDTQRTWIPRRAGSLLLPKNEDARVHISAAGGAQ